MEAADDLGGFARFCLGLANHASGMVGILGRGLDRAGDLVQRRGGLFQRGGLLLGALCQLFGLVRQLAGAAFDGQ